jgi:hypothetical protein
VRLPGSKPPSKTEIYAALERSRYMKFRRRG